MQFDNPATATLAMATSTLPSARGLKYLRVVTGCRLRADPALQFPILTALRSVSREPFQTMSIYSA